MMKKLILILALIFISVTCFPQKGKWKKAQRINTIESYQEFINTYSDSEYTGLAVTKMEALIALKDWNLALKADEITVYEQFLKSHGQSPYASKAKSKIESLTWQLALEKNSYNAYEDYLKRYPKGSKVKEAETRLAGLQIEKARDSFKILEVLATDKEQTFLTGYAIGANGSIPQYEVMTPISEATFIIIDWSLGDFNVRGEKLSISESKLKLLVEGEESQVGYARQLTASPSDEIIWTDAQSSSITYPIGRTPSGKRLFVVKRENLKSLKLQFMDKVYYFESESNTPKNTPLKDSAIILSNNEIIVNEDFTNDAFLFEIDDNKYYLSNFLRIYDKNNSDKLDWTTEEYFELYLNHKLKIKEAIDLGMHKSKKFMDEWNGYRNNLMTEHSGTDLLFLEQEYFEGILLFEISNLMIWEKALQDNEGLLEFFNNNKNKYSGDLNKWRGKIMSDYQTEIEKTWMEELRSKHSITINDIIRSKLSSLYKEYLNNDQILMFRDEYSHFKTR